MREEARTERQAQIERAAYRLLRERGYGGTSMLAIAREARASNETLYRWYGDKNGLFKTMVEANARETREALQRAIEAGDDPLECLENVAPVLLSMLLGERAIALNRAAAADESGELGAAIAAGGKADTLADGFRLAQEAIASGRAKAALAALVECSNR